MSLFADAVGLVKLAKLLRRVEKTWEASAMAEQVSKTKLGAVVAAIAGLCGLFIAVEQGQMSLVNAIVAAVGIIGGLVTAFGARDAAGKVITAIKGK